MKRIFCLVLMSTFFLMGCSSQDKVAFFETFEEKFVNEDYEGLFTLLSYDSQQLISKEEFVARYSNIYGGIQARNMVIEKGEIDNENNSIPFKLSMDTIAGPISHSDFELPFVKEDGEFRIVWSERLIFPMMESGDRVSVRTEESTRGSIIDRTGEKLAKDGLVSRVGIHPAIFDVSDRDAKIQELSSLLDISEEFIINRLEANTNPDHFVTIVDLLQDSPKLEPLKNRGSEGILIEDHAGRVYKNHEAFGRMVGFVGAISAEALEADTEGVYHATSMIGKAGLEQTHEVVLRGIDGIEIFIERDGVNVETLVKRAVHHGEDIQLTIDSELQILVYESMGGERGSASAVDPKTGEVLALVSSPSYNSNIFTTYLTRTEQARREEIEFADEANRFAAVYSPGSTFKLNTAAIGLENGTIHPRELVRIDGMQWQLNSTWGDYRVTRINSQGAVTLRDAIKFSDNIYFAKQALEIGAEQFLRGSEKFTIGTPLTIGFPLNQSQIVNNEDGLQSEILLADTGYGQGEILVTTLNVALDYSMLANNGNIMNPVLIKTEDFEPNILKENIVSEENLAILQDAFVAVIEESDGTGHKSRIEGIRLAGKTGTAEIKQVQGEVGSQNGWFVATDLDESRISIAIMIEDVQDNVGTLGVVEMVRQVLAEYLS